MNTKRNYHHKHRHGSLLKFSNICGFTLLEFLVVVGITVIIGGVGATLLIGNTKNQLFLNEQNDALEKVKQAVKMIVQEAREANNADNGAYPIELADKLVFVFYANIDADLKVERIRYFFDSASGSLAKGVTKPTGSFAVYDSVNENISIIVSNIANTSSNPIFQYYNKDYPADLAENPLPTPANLQAVTFVGIKLLAKSAKLPSANPVEVNSFVQLRNLKNNL